MSGVPVVLSTNGFGLLVTPVDRGAPLLTIAENGKGFPIIIGDKGAPFVIEGLTPAVTLEPLTLQYTQLDEGQSYVISIYGKTNGSTLSITSGSLPPNLTLNSAESTITGTATEGGVFNFTLTETLSGAANSPNDNELSLTVEDLPIVLSPLTLSSSGAIEGVFTTINILGRTAGSLITVGTGSLPDGLTLNSAAGTISGTPTAPAASAFTLVETLAGASNSPLTSSVSITVVATSGIQNIIAPSFVQPDGDGGWIPADPEASNEDVFINVGQWIGGTQPYEYEYAIYNAADDSVIIPRGYNDEVDLTGLIGQTVYARVWCVDATGEAFADTEDFGPIYEASPGVIVGRYCFRGSLAYATSPANVFVVCPVTETGSDGALASPSGMATFPTMLSTSRDGTKSANSGGSGSPVNRSASLATTDFGSRLTGRFSMTTNTVFWAIELPNGTYRIRAVLGDPSTAVTDLRLLIRDGSTASSPVIFESPEGVGHAASEFCLLGEAPDGSLMIRTAAKNDIRAWDNDSLTSGVWSGVIEVTNGALRFERRGTASGSGASLVSFDFKEV